MSVAVIIVNWNSWHDTCIVAEYCLRLPEFQGSIFIVDNGSSDDSWLMLNLWLQGEIKVGQPDAPGRLTGILAQNRVTKLRGLAIESADGIPHHGVETVFLLKSTNAGFSAGNNLAIRLARQVDVFDYFWLLNPDAFPVNGSLQALLDHVPSGPKPVLAGSVLFDYTDADRVQAAGADFDRWRVKSINRLVGESIETLAKQPERMFVACPIGASMFINRAFIEKCGYLEEAYFLYFEELDLASRLPTQSVFVVRDSHVYHRGGSIIKRDAVQHARSQLDVYHFIRSRLLFARKRGLKYLLPAICSTAVYLLRRLVERDYRIFFSAISASYSALGRDAKVHEHR